MSWPKGDHDLADDEGGRAEDVAHDHHQGQLHWSNLCPRYDFLQQDNIVQYRPISYHLEGWKGIKYMYVTIIHLIIKINLCFMKLWPPNAFIAEESRLSGYEYTGELTQIGFLKNCWKQILWKVVFPWEYVECIHHCGFVFFKLLRASNNLRFIFLLEKFS